MYLCPLNQLNSIDNNKLDILKKIFGTDVAEWKADQNNEFFPKRINGKRYLYFFVRLKERTVEYYNLEQKEEDIWSIENKKYFENATDIVEVLLYFIFGWGHDKQKNPISEEQTKEIAKELNDGKSKYKVEGIIKGRDKAGRDDNQAIFPCSKEDRKDIIDEIFNFLSDEIKTDLKDRNNLDNYALEPWGYYLNEKNNKVNVVNFLHNKSQDTDFYDSGYLYYIGYKEDKENGEVKEMTNNNIDNKYDVITIIKEYIENAEQDRKTKQLIFTGAPGTGKTYGVREAVKELCKDCKEQYKFVQFHPSYDYSDFVEGLRPVNLNGATEPSFVRLDGTFKAFCRKIVEDNKKSENNEKKMYYFIVDEINRADLSKVFGELMFGLEESYRGEENRFDTQYMNLKTHEIDENGAAVPIEDDCFKKGFYIPQNLIFIGTMNDIDRSVESFDFALRRRFQWIEIKANDIMNNSLKMMLKNNLEEETMDETIKELSDKVINMNKVISEDGKKFGLSEAFHIGPAYFEYYDGNNLQEIWDDKLLPILNEYTRGRNSDEVDSFKNKCAEALSVNYKRDK
ncbi:MAG: AAA family ATPase [Lachnospiraceae bacterium]|nr:AAA family ATPase [Lachnospiraceae bacterium]